MRRRDDRIDRELGSQTECHPPNFVFSRCFVLSAGRSDQLARPYTSQPLLRLNFLVSELNAPVRVTARSGPQNAERYVSCEQRRMAYLRWEMPRMRGELNSAFNYDR